MTVIDLPIHHDEWVRLQDAVVAVDADDLVNPPVLVHPHPGTADRPHWRIRGNDGTMIEIRHDIASGPPFTVALACQAVKHGALLAIREGSCTLTLDTDGYASLTGQNGSLRGTRPPPGTNRYRSPLENPAVGLRNRNSSADS